MLLCCGKQILPPVWEVPLCYYAFYRLYYVERGFAIYKTPDSPDFLLREGRLYLIPPGKYAVLPCGNHPFTHTWLHLFMAEGPLSIIEFSLKDSLLRKSVDLLDAMISQNLSADFSTRQDSDIFLCISDLISLTINLLNRQTALFPAYRPEILHIINYIRLHPQSLLSNANLAAQCGYHENYFIRLFTAEVGIPPQKYVTQTRIYQAIFLLHQNHSPSSIFSKVGFPNYSTFYRAFKRTTGFPPSRLAHELLFFS